MKYAVVNSESIVVNVVELESGSNWAPATGHSLAQSDVAGIGWVYDGAGFTPPGLPSRPLVDIQADAVAKINAAREALLAAGCADALTGKVYQCDPVARGNWTAMFLATQLPSAGNITIITADNSTITLSPAELQELFVVRIMPWVQAVIHAARGYKDAVLASVDAEGVNTVLDGLTWPQ